MCLDLGNARYAPLRLAVARFVPSLPPIESGNHVVLVPARYGLDVLLVHERGAEEVCFGTKVSFELWWNGRARDLRGARWLLFRELRLRFRRALRFCFPLGRGESARRTGTVASPPRPAPTRRLLCRVAMARRCT